MLRNHRDLILNWFRAKGQLSSGVVEGLREPLIIQFSAADSGFFPKSLFFVKLRLFHTGKSIIF
jgi:hypothetical protein